LSKERRGCDLRDRDGATLLRISAAVASNLHFAASRDLTRMAGATVVGVLVIGLLSSTLDHRDPPAGYVKIVTGAVFVMRAAAEIPAHPGDAIYEDDTLRTGVDGRLGVTLKDDTRVSLGPNSEIALSEFKFSPAEGQLGLVMKIVRGVAAFVTGRIAKLQPNAVRIETPTAIIGVRGTHIAVRAEGP
jgi:hypothetical protein